MGGAVDREEAIRLASVVADYRAFEPPLSGERRAEALLELLTSSTGDPFPFEIAWAITAERDPSAAAGSFVRRAISAGHSVTPRARVVTLLSYLLDDPEARPVVVAVMLGHIDDDGVRAIGRSGKRWRSAVTSSGHERRPRARGPRRP